MDISTIISENEMNILKNMIGKTFNKYKCDPFINSPMVYGIVGIYIDEQPFKITSLLKEVKRFLTHDDVAEFKITETTDNNIKTFMDNGQLIETPVNSKIKSISIVNDFQTVTYNGENYEFSSTVGFIFTLEDSREISFEIGTWFSEMITIQRGYNLIEKFTPTDDFLEEWQECEGYTPTIRREITVIE